MRDRVILPRAPHASVAIVILLSIIAGGNGNTIDCTGLATDTLHTLNYVGSITLSIAPDDDLCTLSRITNSTFPNGEEKSLYHPIGRSYDGNDWQSVAGVDATKVSFDCTATECVTTLRPLEEGETYAIARYERNLTNENLASRFLDLVSWGPRMDEITTLAGRFASAADKAEKIRIMAEHIADQMDETTTPPTSHQAYFRRRSGARAYQMTKTSLIGPEPCASGSHWRKFAFTQMDLYLSKTETKDETHEYATPGYTVDIVELLSMVDPNLKKYALFYGGRLRTIVDEPFEFLDTSDPVPMANNSYHLCEVDEIEGSVRDFPDRLGFFAPNADDEIECRLIKGGNPTVNIDEDYFDITLVYQLNLTGYNVSALSSDATIPGKTGGGIWQLNENIIDANACDDLPSPLDNDYRDKTDREHGNAGTWRVNGGPLLFDVLNPNWGNSSVFNLDPTIFGILPDGTLGIFDSYILPQENTLENPLSDGGGSIALNSATKANDKNFAMVLKRDGTHDNDGYYKGNPNTGYEEGILSGEEQAVYCSNIAPTFVNEKYCRLSFEPNACMRREKDYEDIVLSVSLDTATLSKIKNITGRHVYAIQNISFDNSPDGNTYVYTRRPLVWLPCAKHDLRIYREDDPDYRDLFPARTDRRFARVSTLSRWVLEAETSCNVAAVPVSSDTQKLFARLLSESADKNPLIRDIYRQGVNEQCATDDEEKHGMYVRDNDGNCWRNVHPDYLSVYDMTDYMADEHPGGLNITTPGFLSFLTNIPNQTMKDWEITSSKYWKKIHKLGRYMDQVEVVTLVDKMRIAGDNNIFQLAMRRNASDITVAIATEFGKPIIEAQFHKTGRGGGVVVCGNPGEVAPDHTQEDTFELSSNSRTKPYDGAGFGGDQKKTVWTSVNIFENDQLRQKMAWSLNKIFSVASVLTVDSALNEGPMAFYDIGVRGAFGTFFDILKEVVFSSEVAEQFTYRGSKAIRTYINEDQIQFPDENMGRESMQLMTTGLHKRLIDGSPDLDDDQRLQKVYENYHVETNARVFTGFTEPPRRGNVEDKDRVHSRVDLLVLNLDDHDLMPKRDLNDGWLGDGYPLCVDLPQKHFLKKSATWKLLGSQSTPHVGWKDGRSHWRGGEWEGNSKVKRLILQQNSSELYQALCAAPTENSNCTYPPIVTLEDNLSCDQDLDPECRVDMVRVVQVSDGIYYEYHRPPCVQLSYFHNAKQVNAKGNNFNMCANPKMPVATRMCCGASYLWISFRDQTPSQGLANQYVEFDGELVKYETNDAFCADVADANARDITACNEDIGAGFLSSPTDTPSYFFFHSGRFPSGNVWQWTRGECNLQMKVRSDGYVALIHKPSYVHLDTGTTAYVDKDNTLDYISVPWKETKALKPFFPNYNNDCGQGACILNENDNTCLCNITLEEAAVFNGTGLPSRQAILANCYVGAFNPAIMDNYTLLADNDLTGDGRVEAWGLFNEGINTTNTIYNLTNDYGKVLYLKNFKSTIRWDEEQTDDDKYGIERTLRNMPNFNDIVTPELRDAHYEIDAYLKMLITHDSTAPNIVTLLIKHFGISNPSPKYVKDIATTFKRGTYTVANNITFGRGEYGDLAATTAAILLHQEATSAVLDADPTQGSLRDPISVVLKAMRSLEYKRTPQDKQIFPILDNMDEKIGQEVFSAIDQFGFFDPDYKPPGEFASAGLTAPESQLLSTPWLTGRINGLIEMISDGLRGDTLYGFGKKNLLSGTGNETVGYLSFLPSQSSLEFINTIDTLLTNGRLGSSNKAILQDIYNKTESVSGNVQAKRVVQQLVATTQEFHTSRVVERKNGKARLPSPKADPANVDYKAIVVLNLFGGLDSFNVLAPKNEGDCTDLFSEYKTVRGNVGMTNSELLPINGTGSNQTCNSFGVHYELPKLKEIYDNEDGLFLANFGHLTKKVMKDDYLLETRADLFSHHGMNYEAQLVDPFKEARGTGVLGRLLDIMQEQKKMAVSPISIDSLTVMLDGKPELGRFFDILPKAGVKTFNFDDTIKDAVRNLHSDTEVNSGLYGNLFSQSVIDTWNRTDALSSILKNQDVQATIGGARGSHFKQILAMVASASERGVNREAFVVRYGGFDNHGNLKNSLKYLLPNVNAAIEGFYDGLKTMNMLDSVTTIIISEFGRTITPNTSGGTDHGWGGNYFMFGGGTKGKRILGKYPESFSDSDPTNIGRGRTLPTMSWDALWYGVAQWFGVDNDKDMNYVLPNNQNFGCALLSESDIYRNGTSKVSGCGGGEVEYPMKVGVEFPRYLTGEEQKKLCSEAISRTSQAVNSTTRCIILSQKLVVSIGGQQRKRVLDAEGQVSPPDNSILFAVSLFGNEETSVEKIANVSEDALISIEYKDFIRNYTNGSVVFVEKTDAPSLAPTLPPSKSHAPSSMPSASTAPSKSSMPSSSPSLTPTNTPSISSHPSSTPSLSVMPSNDPSSSPSISQEPSLTPSSLPSISSHPSRQPSSTPSLSVMPSDDPSSSPSISQEPSLTPSSLPSISSHPSRQPSSSPSLSVMPSDDPSSSPSISQKPSLTPANTPSISSHPSRQPSSTPSLSLMPSNDPSSSPSISQEPSLTPTNTPSISSHPSRQPSLTPSLSVMPSMLPSISMVPTVPDGLNLETIFSPDVISQGGEGTLVFKATNNQLTGPVNIIVTSTIDDLLQIKNIDDRNDWNCNASGGQNISCTGNVPSGGSKEFNVSYSALSFASNVPVSCENDGGSLFYIQFENGKFLHGCSNGGPIHLDGIDITNRVKATKHIIAFSGFYLDLTCEDSFPNGWSGLNETGPSEIDNPKWRILFYNIYRFNKNKYIMSCSNTIDTFSIVNTATLTVGNYAVQSTATLSVGPGITTATANVFNKGHKATVKTSFSNGHTETAITGLKVCFDGSLGRLNRATCKCEDSKSVIWSGSLDPGCVLLQDNVGWTPTPLLVYADQNCDLELGFNSDKKEDVRKIRLDDGNLIELNFGGAIYQVGWDHEMPEAK